MQRQQFDKPKLIKMMQRYHDEIQREYGSSQADFVKRAKLGMKQQQDRVKQNIKPDTEASKKSLTTFAARIRDNKTKIITDILRKYSSQIAISAYYEIFIVFSDTDDIKQSEDTDDFIIRCSCDQLMIRIKLRNIYSDGACCDECDRHLYLPHMYIFHCPSGNDPQHEHGFDLCHDCATTNAKYNEMLRVESTLDAIIAANTSSSTTVNQSAMDSTSSPTQIWINKHGVDDGRGCIAIDMHLYQRSLMQIQNLTIIKSLQLATMNLNIQLVCT